MKSKFLGNISTEKFLKEYWNKKPLLIKNAVSNISSFADFNDFLEMGKDAEFETRIVYEKGGDYPWQAKLGPFKNKDYKKNALWTLICHNLELLNSDFFKLKENVRFAPDWHFDDIMATISKKGASVGAHIDDYSVFIVQGKGSRKWLLEENPNPAYIENLDIRLLKKFKPNIEWVLESGDMIYIPPNIAHHGISLEDSISYSLGFKSIRYKNLLDNYITELMSELDDASFHDLQMPKATDSFLVEDYVVNKVYDEIFKIINNKETFKESLLKHLSRPKNISEEECTFDNNQIKKLITSKLKLKRDLWAKLASRSSKNKFIVSINSNNFTVTKATYSSLKTWFLLDPDSSFKLQSSELKNMELVELLAILIKNGVFFPN
jgi:50S ribosomal protein L16 3-hydroxylase